ncbi:MULTISPECIES: hypothetical protein [unclassified Isoptericola]|uniref:hypothetical protein n=1 Tax=unclassified Isoptericola TaxID=2623355 RepID=UPI0027129CD9|nr:MULTISPECIES: hypothetical protein [unclassified Isoptericola]MDO8144355.1 hypothetical protein [Isoptericola sp. 178]MDO8151686.1 hypothetical protein [Isoptericola sp. b408]
MFTQRVAAALAAAGAALLITASPALAAPNGNPHFIGNFMEASVDGDFDLTVSFKEAGLPSGAVETITAYADLEATYQCINGGGNNPADPKKTTITTQVSGSDTFTAGKNGQIVGSVTLAVVPAADVLECPGGQTSTLTAGTWTNISIEDETSGAFYSFGDESFSFGAPVGHGKNT